MDLQYHQRGPAAMAAPAVRFEGDRRRTDLSEMDHSSHSQPIPTPKKGRQLVSEDTVRAKPRSTRAWDSSYSKHPNKADKFIQHISSRRHQPRPRRLGRWEVRWRLYTTGLDSACLCRFHNTKADLSI